MMAAGDCQYCGGRHAGRVCHLVRAFEYDQTGSIRRVEFHAPPHREPVRRDLGATLVAAAAHSSVMGGGWR